MSSRVAKKYGFWTLTFLVIANMVGAGVFTTSGFSLLDLNSPKIVLLAWLVGGIIAICGAASYGQLIKVLPESGGEYLFLSRAAHPMLGFIGGWVSLIAGFSGAIAFAASALEGYVLPERTRPDWLPTGTIAITAIFLAGGLHGIRARAGAGMQNLVVVLKLGLLVGFLVVAATKMTALPATDAVSILPPQGWELVSSFAMSIVWISLSYSGFNAAVYVAGEVDDPERIVPRTLVVGTLVVTVFYLLLNAIFLFAGPIESIRGQEDVAAIAAAAIGGDALANFVRVIIAICLWTSVLSMMMAAPRVYAKMAEDGLMPRWLQFQGDAPVLATIAQIGLASLIVAVTRLQDLLSYLGLTLSLTAASAVACLFLPHMRRKGVSGVHLTLPAIYVVATITAAVLMTIAKPIQMLGTMITALVGVVAYALARR